MTERVEEGRAGIGSVGASEQKIDVHCHFLTARYQREAAAAGHSEPDGNPGFPEWDVATTLEMMDRRRIATAILSVSSPGVHFGDDEAARSLARHVNDEAAATASSHPGRFGFFASLPLPDLDGGIQEATYALDELGADGVVIKTHSGGIHLGDALFDPLLAELDDRSAVVFIHPTSPLGWRDVSMGFGPPMLEFLFETTRAVMNLVLRGVPRRFPNVRFVVPHGGAAIPLLADRVAAFVEIPGFAKVDTQDEVFEALGGFWYDLAGWPRRQLPALLSLVDPSRLLYGSDWPFTPEEAIAPLAAELDRNDALTEEERTAMFSGNATRLLRHLGEP